MTKTVAQRITHATSLRLLSRDETRAYIEHRCRVAGATNDPFDEQAHEVIFEMSRGNLPAIDRLALKALQAAAKAGAQAVSTAEVLTGRQQLWL